MSEYLVNVNTENPGFDESEKKLGIYIAFRWQFVKMPHVRLLLKMDTIGHPI